jgi:hypothetical protein
LDFTSSFLVLPLVFFFLKLQLWERFEVEAGAMYQEAANSTANSFAKIPPWFYVVLLILGWNELWAILTNPLYLFVAVIVAGAIFAIVSLNLQGPALQMTSTVTNEAYKIAMAKLGDYVKPKDPLPVPSRNSDPRDKLKTM